MMMIRHPLVDGLTAIESFNSGHRSARVGLGIAQQQRQRSLPVQDREIAQILARTQSRY
jgi:hypothetical protein